MGRRTGRSRPRRLHGRHTRRCCNDDGSDWSQGRSLTRGEGRRGCRPCSRGRERGLGRRHRHRCRDRGRCRDRFKVIKAAIFEGISIPIPYAESPKRRSATPLLTNASSATRALARAPKGAPALLIRSSMRRRVTIQVWIWKVRVTTDADASIGGVARLFKGNQREKKKEMNE